MINKEEILKHVQRLGKESSIEEITNLIDSQDRDKIKKEQKERFFYELWDKKSPINDVPAQEILEDKTYAINNAYLIYIDNKLVYFQDHAPNQSGFVKMTKTEAKEFAEDFIDKKIEENTDNVIVKNVIDAITSK